PPPPPPAPPPAGPGPPAPPPSGAQTGSWIAGREPGYPPTIRGWALPGSTYGATADRGEGEARWLRAAQLARLGPRVGDLIWDIGAGSGGTAVEAARFGAAVIAVDQDADACGRITAVGRRFQVQLQVVHGTAPQVLEDLPEPDAIRIGGGGVAVVTACAARRPERIVTHAATRDQAEAISRALTDGGYGVECVMLQAVEMDARAWSERDRSVAFLLCGHRPHP
ncbi:precorrin-6y C5,15-methyltransferase (decarboxylating) subunit CbiE, partial [Streptomyces sp. HSW2009]